VSFMGKVLSNLVVLHNPDGAHFQISPWPSQFWVPKAAVNYEEFSVLLNGSSGLNQSAGGPASTIIVPNLRADIVMFRSGKKRRFKRGP
jgi:hypothetical protein